ncbi:MAG: methylmalonyl-CoA mutase subunit beta [Flavobacteriaceae bacterium]
MSENLLFSEFSQLTNKEWKQKIHADLKGADYNETLIWESPEGIKVKPFYTAEDQNNARDIEIETGSWSIGQKIFSDDPDLINSKCAEALDQGVDSLIIAVGSESESPKNYFTGIALKDEKVFLDAAALPPEKLSLCLKDIPVEQDRLYVLHDIVGQLTATGNWYSNLDADFKKLEEVLVANPGSKVVSVNASRYQNAGANRVQQIAYALAHAAEYLKRLDSQYLSHITFMISVDTNYFFEIAKIKALRILWQRLISERDANISSHLLSFPTTRNKSIYDYNVNMLRTTTECMSAILGGADTIYNLPYDHIYHKDNEFANRIARNQLLILRNESYFDQVDNAAAGSYYIQHLTSEMASSAWSLYEQIQSAGGFLRQLKDHKIQKKIKESAQKQQQAFNNGEEILVGSNKYINEADLMTDQLQKDPFLKIERKKTLIEPILEKRLTESLEKNRLDHE